MLIWLIILSFSHFVTALTLTLSIQKASGLNKSPHQWFPQQYFAGPCL